MLALRSLLGAAAWLAQQQQQQQQQQHATALSGARTNQNRACRHTVPNPCMCDGDNNLRPLPVCEAGGVPPCRHVRREVCARPSAPTLSAEPPGATSQGRIYTSPLAYPRRALGGDRRPPSRRPRAAPVCRIAFAREVWTSTPAAECVDGRASVGRPRRTGERAWRRTVREGRRPRFPRRLRAGSIDESDARGEASLCTPSCRGPFLGTPRLLRAASVLKRARACACVRGRPACPPPTCVPLRRPRVWRAVESSRGGGGTAGVRPRPSAAALRAWSGGTPAEQTHAFERRAVALPP